MIKRIIVRQYNQLDEICKQILAEIDDLDVSLSDPNSIQCVEIQQTRELIASIELEIKLKTQEMHRLEIRARHDQLINIYEQTSQEVKLLETLLENNVSTHSNVTASSLQSIDNLSASNKQQQMPPLINNQRLDLTGNANRRPTIKNNYSDVLEKWQKSLKKVDNYD